MISTHQTVAARIVHLVIDDNGKDAVVEVTGRHPFWVLGRGWKHAEDLAPDDKLKDAAGGPVTVLRAWSEQHEVPTYNLTVETAHTYFVVAGSKSLLVHNIDPFDIKFSQQSIEPEFAQGPWAGKSLDSAIAETQRLGHLPEGLELEVMKFNDSYVTLNNRTLYVAQQANLSQVHPIIRGAEATNTVTRMFREGSGAHRIPSKFGANR